MSTKAQPPQLITPEVRKITTAFNSAAQKKTALHAMVERTASPVRAAEIASTAAPPVCVPAVSAGEPTTANIAAVTGLVQREKSAALVREKQHVLPATTQDITNAQCVTEKNPAMYVKVRKFAPPAMEKVKSMLPN